MGKILDLLFIFSHKRYSQKEKRKKKEKESEKALRSLFAAPYRLGY